MKTEIIDPKETAFQPFAITLTFETRKELQMYLAISMAGFNPKDETTEFTRYATRLALEVEDGFKELKNCTAEDWRELFDALAPVQSTWAELRQKAAQD